MIRRNIAITTAATPTVKGVPIIFFYLGHPFHAVYNPRPPR